MNDDIERILSEIGPEAVHESIDGKIPGIAITLVCSDVLGNVGEGVKRRIQRVDPLELEQLTGRKAPRLVHFAPLEEIHEDVQRRRPRSHANAGAGLGQGLGDGKAEAAVVGHAGNERPAPGKVDVQHAGDMSFCGNGGKGCGKRCALRIVD